MKNKLTYKILIVDDVTKNIQLVASILQQAGYEIFFALNGPMALDLVKDQTIDLILLDIMMPEMDGFETCKQIKELPNVHDVPIIFLTAKTDIESIKNGFNIGGVDYITKPFNREELLARVKTHLALMQQQQELKELNATKDKFFSIIAHDLKSPFNHLLGLTEIINNLAEKSDNKEILEISELINKSAKRGKNLLDNLLEWSRSQIGTHIFNPKNIVLFDSVDETISFASSMAAEKHISIVNDIPQKTIVLADINMLNTILRNLISNAIKFTNPDGVVRIYARDLKHSVKITVEDNGIGISNSILPKLFNIEENPSTIGTGSEKGTGLGLILCREFVDRHGGEIYVKSERGMGSKFIFKLPKKNQL